MIKATKVPRGVANLFAINDCVTINIPEKWNHRPDKILDSIGKKSMAGEILNNYISVKSPISLNSTDPYVVTDDLFQKYFFNN